MKRISILILAACLAAQTMMAGPVSPGRAVEIGKRILSSGQNQKRSANVSIVWDGESAPTRSSENAAFYVVARDGGGFVIISGDDNARPVLAISENSPFEVENMPENMKWWMDRLKAYVRSQVTPKADIQAQWASLAVTRAGDNASISGTVTDKIEHLTPEWNQGNSDNYYFGRQVFNKFCPRDANGNLTITGCGATSLAEILTTLSGIYPDDMPVKGTGMVGGYTVGSGYTAPAQYELTTRYDWAGLRTLTGTDAINQAIRDGKTSLLDDLGHLLADCGAIIQASYTKSGTSSGNGSNITKGMFEHMSMSKTARVVWADNYSLAEWKTMIKTDVSVRPIFYSGQSQSGGHGFVFDGVGKYGDEDVFHVNFGWSGSGNGYYFVDHLDSGNGDYSDHGMDAILDFYPDARHLATYPYEIQFVALDDDMIGLTSDRTIEAGQPFVVYAGGFVNAGTETYTGPIIMAIEDKNGNWRSYYSLFGSRTLSPGDSPITRTLYIQRDNFSFGDKFGALFEYGGSYVDVSYPKDGTIVGELPLTPGAFIVTEPSYNTGDFFVFQIKNYNALYAGTQWTITDPNGNSTTMAQSAGRYQLTQTGKYKIVARIKPAANSEVVENVVAFITVQ